MNDHERLLASCNRKSIQAPAGCGKTRLIAKAIKHSPGIQLVLTHTHAGVRAIRNHLVTEGISNKRCVIETLDGFALQYAAAFPTFSGLRNTDPESIDWRLIRAGAVKALKFRAVQTIITTSFAGIFVDEYQDCSIQQHELVTLLAELVPCRVLGDPMQAIFAPVNKENALGWNFVESFFEPAFELETPHRWMPQNQELGAWTLEIRRLLISGNPIDLRKAPSSVNWVSSIEQQNQIGACKKSSSKSSVIGILETRHQCSHLAKFLNNKYKALETVECEELLEFAQRFDDPCGCNRLQSFAEMIECTLSKASWVKQMAEKLAAGKYLRPEKSERIQIAMVLKKICDEPGDVKPILDAMIAICNLACIGYSREILWRDMMRCLHEHCVSPRSSFTETVNHIKNIDRRIGRKIYGRCLGTTLLVKGLEFKHSIILNANAVKTAESLYVALTRGCESITVLSSTPILQKPIPLYLSDVGSKGCDLISASSAQMDLFA